MSRPFLSPGEKRLLATLPPREAQFIREVMDELDAHLIPNCEPRRAARADETDQSAMLHAGQQQLRGMLRFEL